MSARALETRVLRRVRAAALLQLLQKRLLVAALANAVRAAAASMCAH